MELSTIDAIDLQLLEPLLRQMVDLIGLPATMAIVEAHGGRVQAGPAPGKGTAFAIRLPRVSADRTG